MRCSHCSSLMAEIETQQDGRTEQSRFECPVCGRSHLITQRMEMTDRRQVSSRDLVFQGSRDWLGKLG